MKTADPDSAWRRTCQFVCDVLNPLLIIALALYVSLGLILTRFAAFSIEHWVALFWFCILLPLYPLMRRARTRWRAGQTRRGHSPLSLAPFLLLLPGIALEFGSPTLQVLHHADVHLAFIHQLLYESTPVESVFVAGYPPAYHWLYHAILAPLVHMTGFAPPSVASLVTVIAMFSSFVWISAALDALGICKSRSFKRSLLIMLVYFSLNLTSPLTVLSHIVAGNWNGFSNQLMLLPGANEHLHSLYKQVMNFNSVDLGLLCFVAGLCACLKMARDKPDAFQLAMFSAAGIGALAVREIAALYIVCAVSAGYALALGLDWLRSPQKTSPWLWVWRALTAQVSPRFIAIWLLLSLALSLPLLGYNLDIVSGFDAGKPYGLSIPNLQMIVAAALLLLPFVALNAVYAWQSRNLAWLALQCSCVLALGMTFVLTLPDRNQSKAVYFLCLLLALAALCALERLAQSISPRTRRFGKIAITGFCLLLIGQLVYSTANFRGTDSGYTQSAFYYDGMHVERAADIDGRLPGYLWIRDETPADAIVVLPIVVTRDSNLYHERLLYLRQPHLHFAASVINVTERAHHIGVVYDSARDDMDYQDIIGRMGDELPDHDFFAVIKESEVSRTQMQRRGAKLVFDGGYNAAHVYWLNPD